MCLLIVKPKGVDIPSQEILDMAYRRNSDGNGFATKNYFFKTLNYDEFIKKLRNVGRDDACIIHFRRATQGSICKQNCHPFKYKDVYFAHNGILNFTPKSDITDSEYAFRRFLVPVIRRYGIDSVEVAQAVSQIIGWSKFAILQGDKIIRFGQFVNIDGCYYSNTYYL